MSIQWLQSANFSLTEVIVQVTFPFMRIDITIHCGFVPGDERMQVIDTYGNLVPHLYCIGNANGKLMLAHAATAQGISLVEQITGRDHVLNHVNIPATFFAHPEMSMVGLTEPKSVKEGFERVSKTSFKAITKALAENEAEGLAKLIYRPDSGKILAVHIFGLHAADLVHEASSAIALGTRVQVKEQALKSSKRTSCCLIFPDYTFFTKSACSVV